MVNRTLADPEAVAVHLMGDNVRQRDPAERIALAHLRAAEVATVAAWSADVAQGASTAMYAWKRANVAELNRRGRLAYEEAGRLSGPELVIATQRMVRSHGVDDTGGGVRRLR